MATHNLDALASISSATTWFVWASKGLSIGALLVQWLELFQNLPDEIELLWKTPLRLITCLYAWSRYFPIFAQGVNFAFSILIHRPSPNPRLCMATYVLKAITAQLATTCLEAILAVRVHALYGRSKASGVFLAVIMAVGTVFEFVGASLAMMRLQPGPGGNICIPGKTPRNSLIMFITGWTLIQSVLLVMTLARVFVYRRDAPTGPSLHRDAPVVTLMMRDGVVVFVVLIAVVGGMTSFEMGRNDTTLVWHSAFSWYVTLVSIVGCRVIMNMRKLAAQPARRAAQHTNLFTSIPHSPDLISFELSFFSRPSGSRDTPSSSL